MGNSYSSSSKLTSIKRSHSSHLPFIHNKSSQSKSNYKNSISTCFEHSNNNNNNDDNVFIEF